MLLLWLVPAEMWEQLFSHVDKQAHMKAMFELTTRMNSLARIVVGPANISATTALQVRHARTYSTVVGAWVCMQPQTLIPNGFCTQARQAEV